MAHSPGDLVEIVVGKEDDKVTATVPAIVVGKADEKGESVSVHILAGNHYASDGNEMGQIYVKSSAKSESKKKAETAKK